MKNTIFIIFILYNTITFGQFSSGKITYQYQYKGEPFKAKTQNKVAQQAVNDLYKTLLSYSGKINYILVFKNELSKYAIENTLNSESDAGLENAKNMTGAREVIYMNTSQKYTLKELDFFGDEILVKSTLKNDWNLTQETRKIGGYVCFKAWKKVNNTVLIEAWYTPEIPLNIGPRGFGNLPGLILELKQAELSYVASEIILNPKKSPTIKLPKNKKIVKEAEFNKLLLDFDKGKRN